jgi:nucleotide-binding universal stress UspA family protein
VLVGRPSTAIVDYASEVDAEMIVMTTHGYRGVKHVLLGSTAEDVLRRAACPVLTVRAGT